jgi:hypothetical protein
MRRYTRIIFGLNALHQTALGGVCLVLPSLSLGLHGASPALAQGTLLLASCRILGVHLLFGGVLSALVARDPDRYPVLLLLMGLMGLLTSAGLGLALALGELNLRQAGPGLVLQVLVLAAVLGYGRQAFFRKGR